jgi:hypothetical protein
LQFLVPVSERTLKCREPFFIRIGQRTGGRGLLDLSRLSLKRQFQRQVIAILYFWLQSIQGITIRGAHLARAVVTAFGARQWR